LIWNREAETLPRERLQRLQLNRLGTTLARLLAVRCGRTHARMSAVKGRLDDMLIIRGVNLYPTEVERVLLTMDDVSPTYQLVVDRPAALDELTVVCEPASANADPEGLRTRVARAVREAIGLAVRVKIAAAGRLHLPPPCRLV
jgi:phenylacetate-CoA ligase